MSTFARASVGSGRSFSRGINVAFIRSTSYFFFQEQLTPPTPRRHTILAFLVPLLQKFLQLQCQGKVASPFQTHPNTMFVAITSLFVYCFAYDAELRFYSTDHPAPVYAPVISCVKALSDSLFLVSLTSILFPDSARMVLYLLYILFLANEFLHRQLQMLWNWLHQRVINRFMQERRMRRASTNRRFWFITPASADRGGLLPLYL